jgi:aminopeptidase N
VTSLTRDAARLRSASVEVDEYAVGLDLTGDGPFFDCRTTVRFRAATEAATFLDVAPHALIDARLNGAPVDLATAFDAATRRLHVTPAPGGNELVVDAVMAYSHDGEGLHRHVDPADGRAYLYAMSFLSAAPRWFACFDQPDLKAPLTLDVRCPPDWSMRGNGPAERIEPGHWRIASAGPLATYFTTLVAGPYHEVHDRHDGIALSLLARRSLAEHLDQQAGELLAHTKHCLDELHALFGVRYPWGEYHQAFVPDFNAGAMENPGCVTLRDKLIFRAQATDSERLGRRITIAHEMAHMWFGDLVTMRWWDDLWLNESFAEYLGCRISGEHAWVDFGIARKSWGYAADRRPSTHPVAGNGAADAASALTEFDGISYAKGASALRQLALHLGDDLFLDGLRNYIRTHANANAEFADLVAAWTRAGAAGMDKWTRAWLRTTGLDELSVHGGRLSRRSPDGSRRPHAIAVAGYGRDGAQLALTRVTIDGERAATDLPRGAVVLPDARDETWAKVVLPHESWLAMPDLLGRIADARARVAVWNALQLAVADAEVDPALALDTVVGALPHENDDAVLAAVGRWVVRRLVGCCVPDGARHAASERLAESLLRVVDGSGPGTARRLAAARIVIAASSDRDMLHGWLDGSAAPTGLAIDTELRWAVLHRLAALGAVDDAEIGAEAARDHSSAGAVHAARCRAARPDAAAKDAAWAAIMRDAALPNYELYALAEGFWEPDQRALTDPYVPRYFAEIAATAQLRAGWVVDRLALLAYPWTAVDEATLTATDELLSRSDVPSGIRRSVIDAGDDLRRTVAIRRRYAPLNPQ